MTTGASYLRALRSLQGALDHDHSSVAAETLAAATLLQMYEHSVASAHGGWLVHAKGVIKMLKLRGPRRMQDPIERSTLQVQVGNIFAEAIRDRKPCFLAEPEWNVHIQQSTFNRSHDPVPQEFAAMLAMGVRIAGTLCLYEQLQTNATSGLALRLFEELNDARQQHQEWLDLYCPNYERETLSIMSWRESTSRIEAVTQLSITTFLASIDYMLFDVLCSNQLQAEQKEQFYLTNTLDPNDITKQCRLSSLIAKSRWLDLKREDAVAADNTNSLLNAMLLRVLQASRNDGSEHGLRPVIDDLTSYLIANA